MPCHSINNSFILHIIFLDEIAKIVCSLSEDVIHSLTGWQYILDALSL